MEALLNLEVLNLYINKTVSFWSLGLTFVPIAGDLFLLFRTTESQPHFIHPLCKKDCVWIRRDEELVRRMWEDWWEDWWED